MSIDAPSLQITVQEQERWRRRMSVTVPAQVVRDERHQAAAKLAKRLKIPGFRKGRIPSSVVESRFGQALDQETLDRVIDQAYRSALSAEELRPISEGKLEDLVYQPDEDLTFAIAFDVQPQIELSRLGGFTVERPALEVTGEHVDQVLDRLRTQNGLWQPAEEGTPQDGELVAVKIQKLEGGEPVGKTRDYQLVLGQGDAIPDVENAIRTLSVGETGTFVVTFPDDFSDVERRGQEEEIRVEMVGRSTLVLPDLDDDFARQVGDFESLDDLLAKVRADLRRDADEQAESVVRGRLLDLVIEANPFEVPESMVERYADSVLGEQPGLPPEKLEELRQAVRPQAEAAVKRILAIDRIAHTQELDATEDEIDARVEEIARKNGATAAKVYAELQKAGRLESLEREITENKVFDFLKSQSEITEEAG